MKTKSFHDIILMFMNILKVKNLDNLQHLYVLFIIFVCVGVTKKQNWDRNQKHARK